MGTRLQTPPLGFPAGCGVIVAHGGKNEDIKFSHSRMRSFTAPCTETELAVTCIFMIYGEGA